MLISSCACRMVGPRSEIVVRDGCLDIDLDPSELFAAGFLALAFFTTSFRGSIEDGSG